jgi:hypothetical protein
VASPMALACWLHGHFWWPQPGNRVKCVRCGTSRPENERGCICGEKDAEVYPDDTDRVIVPTAAGCPVHDPRPENERG